MSQVQHAWRSKHGDGLGAVFSLARDAAGLRQRRWFILSSVWLQSTQEAMMLSRLVDYFAMPQGPISKPCVASSYDVIEADVSSTQHSD